MSAVAQDEWTFSGDWLLLPERASYQFGLPHRAGSYHVNEDAGGWVIIESRWVSATGRTQAISFRGRLDGRLYPYTSTAMADHLRFEPPSATLLTSSAWKNGRMVQWAERELLRSDLLEIRLHGRLANGNAYTNTDVYRRMHEPA